VQPAAASTGEAAAATAQPAAAQAAAAAPAAAQMASPAAAPAAAPARARKPGMGLDGKPCPACRGAHKRHTCDRAGAMVPPAAKPAKPRKPRGRNTAPALPAASGRPGRVRKANSLYANDSTVIGLKNLSALKVKDVKETPKPLPELLPYATMLNKLAARRDARPFAAPMRELWDPAALTDYFNKIKQPMDLRTISERLARGEYNSAGHAALAADVRLIWSNCKTYTPNPDNIYHQQANRMSEWFEADYEALRKAGEEAKEREAAAAAAQAKAEKERAEREVSTAASTRLSSLGRVPHTPTALLRRPRSSRRALLLRRRVPSLPPSAKSRLRTARPCPSPRWGRARGRAAARSASARRTSASSRRTTSWSTSPS